MTAIESPPDPILVAEADLLRCGASLDAVNALSDAMFDALVGKSLEDTETLMRRIGRLLVDRGLPDLWILVYQAYLQVHFGGDHEYRVGEAERFLQGKPAPGDLNYQRG